MADRSRQFHKALREIIAKDAATKGVRAKQAGRRQQGVGSVRRAQYSPHAAIADQPEDSVYGSPLSLSNLPRLSMEGSNNVMGCIDTGVGGTFHKTLFLG